MQIKMGCCDLTILEGKKLKDAVHDGDNNGETQQVRVGFQKGHLYKEIFFWNLKLQWSHNIHFYVRSEINARQSNFIPRNWREVKLVYVKCFIYDTVHGIQR